MEKIKISLDDGGVRTLSEVRYVPELRKNLISLGTLQVNGFSLWLERDRDIMKASKDSVIVMWAKRIVGNIYKLLSFTIMGDVASVETDNDATRLWHMPLRLLNEKRMMELHWGNLL